MSKKLSEADYKAGMLRLRDRVALMRQALERAQWTYDTGRLARYCPACELSEQQGHDADCVIAAALRG